MSADAAAEPGVPVETEPSYIPPAGEKSVAKEVEKRAPSGLINIASKPDKIILRLNKYVQPHIATPNTLSNNISTDFSQHQAAPARSSQPSTTPYGSLPSSKPNLSHCRQSSSNTSEKQPTQPPQSQAHPPSSPSPPCSPAPAQPCASWACRRSTHGCASSCKARKRARTACSTPRP